MRLAIFFFYDKDGTVREFVTYYLRCLHNVAQKVFVVINGEVTGESMEKLEAVSDEILIRENIGFDVWAYKEAIEQLGWETIKIYDELILCNFTCYGPIYPFQEMFNEMETRECDFWGAVKHPEQPDYLLPGKRGYIYEHIMSYFTVIRHKMLRSIDFQQYWENVPKINSKTESTALHETVFTRHFEQLGFKSDSYVDLEKYKDRCNNSSIFFADELLIQDRCPLLKRRAFAFPLYENLLGESAGSSATKLMAYIQNDTDYDVDLIWEDLLETQPMSIIRNNMHLSCIVPKKTYVTDRSRSAIFLIYIENIKQLKMLHKVFSKIEEKVILLFDKEEIGAACNEYEESDRYQFLKINSEECGTIIACFLACEKFFEKYEYCCCIFSYHKIESRLQQAYEDYSRHIYDSLFENSDHIEYILEKFQKSPRLGCLAPYKTEFSSYYAQPFQYIKGRESIYQSVYNQVNLRVPFDQTSYFDPNFAFWIRKGVLQHIVSLLKKPEKAYCLSLENAITFLTPMLAQECGFYTASITSLNSAVRLLDNYEYMRNYSLAKLRSSGFFGHRFYDVALYSARNKTVIQESFDINKMLHQKIALRNLIRLFIRYPKNKIDNLYQKLLKLRQHLKHKDYVPVSYGTYIANITLEEGRLVFYFLTRHPQADKLYLKIDRKKYFCKKYLSEGQKSLAKYINDYGYGKALFFEVPLACLKEQKIVLFDQSGVQINVAWSSNFSFNALELRKYNLYVRVESGVIWIQSKIKFCVSVFLSHNYAIGSKMLFLCVLLNYYHPYTLFAENGNASDNSFQLFNYALKRGENVYFVTSKAVKDSEKDSKRKRKMVTYNSLRHIWITLLSKRWIGSYSLRVELLPTKMLHDIHYAFLPAEWDFIPHGMIVGDKEVAMLQHYNWENPSRTFANSTIEQKAYGEIFGFKNTYYLGSPRMDKWFDAELNANEILIFFTWRMALNPNVHEWTDDKLRNTDYFKIIVDAIKLIRKIYPEKEIHYVFHHEVIRSGCDKLLRKELKIYKINFISMDTISGAEEFNHHFREAQYLITDFSSVAYDFSYKKNSIVIYYLPDNFIVGHYELQSSFYDCQLGVAVKTLSELIMALESSTPSPEILQRRESFFLYHDSCNTERVFQKIFMTPTPNTFLPELQKSYLPPVPKRLGIYFFYDAEGIVDKYVVYYLKELSTVCEEICVVVNGDLNEDGEKQFRAYSNKLIIRKNRGFDSWAYKEAIESYGYNYIADQYDELVLSNFTNFGPIFPFQEMFDAMKKCDCDFWGHNRYPDHGSYIAGTHVIDHIQSYFSVFRKSVLKSPSFKRYWCTLSLPQNYQQAIIFHEVRYTRYFEELGFVSTTFIPWEKYRDFGTNAPVFYAYRQMTEDRSPLLKRKVFYVKGGSFEFPQFDKYSPYDIMQYIKEFTKYDTRFIEENMERTMLLENEKEKDNSIFLKIIAFLCPIRKKKIALYRRANRHFDAAKLYGRMEDKNCRFESEHEEISNLQ